MNRTSAVTLFALAAAVVVGVGLGACSSTPPSGPPDAGNAGGGDAGQVTDAGLDAGEQDAGEDAGEADAGEDAGFDAGLDAGEDAGIDAGEDAGTADAGMQDAGFEGVTCGSQTCAPGEQCCGDFDGGSPNLSCATSCAQDAGIVLTCDGPEDCGGGTPTCCGTITTGAGVPPNCPVQSVTAACSSTCNPNIPLACNTTDEVVRCHAQADCAAFTGYQNCCTFSQSTAAGYFCVPSTFVAVASDCAP